MNRLFEEQFEEASIAALRRFAWPGRSAPGCNILAGEITHAVGKYLLFERREIYSARVNIYEELHWRGLVATATEGTPERLGYPPLVTGKELNAQFAEAAPISEKPITLYCGFDPTAPSLQLGNLMPIMLLRQLQLGGHRPIVLMGGGTGLIGDPSGKKNERPLLSKEQIRENLQHQRDQMGRLLDFDSKETRPLVLDNADWLEQQTLVAFLRDIGKHFTVNLMLQKEAVQARLDAGISFTEFSYMLLQAYDFLHLFRKERCTIQVGGSDQWGNITAGVDLIRRIENAEAHGLVAPLVTMASGQKFGKTEAGAIYLDPKLTSPYKFYQFWINVDDRDVEKYLKLFTLKTQGQIEELVSQQKRDPGGRSAQRALAADVTTRVHNADVLQGIQAASAILFGDEQAEVHPQVFDILAGEIPTIVVEGGSDSVTLVDLVARSGLAKSKSEARRSIEQGGIYVNQQRIDDVARTIAAEDWIGGRNLLLRKGKKEYALLRRAG